MPATRGDEMRDCGYKSDGRSSEGDISSGNRRRKSKRKADVRKPRSSMAKRRLSKLRTRASRAGGGTDMKQTVGPAAPSTNQSPLSVPGASDAGPPQENPGTPPRAAPTPHEPVWPRQAAAMDSRLLSAEYLVDAEMLHQGTEPPRSPDTPEMPTDPVPAGIQPPGFGPILADQQRRRHGHGLLSLALHAPDLVPEPGDVIQLHGCRWSSKSSMIPEELETYFSVDSADRDSWIEPELARRLGKPVGGRVRLQLWRLNKLPVECTLRLRSPEDVMCPMIQLSGHVLES